jgi:type I restriction enzyme S subunit
MSNRFPLVALGELCERTELCDPTLTPTEFFRYVDIGSVSNQWFAIMEAREILGKDAPSRAKKRIRNGDVILSTTRPYLKSIALVQSKFDQCVCSTGFSVLRAKDGVIPEWIFYAVRSQPYMEQLLPNMRGANYPAVTDGDVRACMIPKPKPDEQRRIIARINECFGRVEEMQRLGEDAIAEAPMVEERFLAELEYSLDGCTVPLSELLAETKNGKSLQNKENVHNGRALTLSAVRTHRLDMSASKSVQINAGRDDNYLMRPGDVLISRSNTRELVALSAIAPDHIDEPTIFSDLLIRLTPKPKAIRPLYLTIALRMPGVRHQLRANAVGSSQTMVKISGERLRTVKVPCPSPAEQERIEAKYTEVASVTSAISAELNEQTKDLNAFREAILREAFAGNL